MVISVTRLYPFHESPDTFPVAGAPHPEIRQDLVDNHGFLPGPPYSQNQVVIVVDPLAGIQATFVVRLFRDERRRMVPMPAGGEAVVS